ncbi:MAG: TonB-dependent receptor plug domain-containing protein, partial [Planctomycetota bacterium]
AQYGSDAIGGVVNIITRKAGPTPELSLGTSAGHYDTYTGDFGLLQPLSDRVRVSAFLNREQSHGVPIKAPRHRVGEMGYQSCRALARLDADLSETTSVFGWVHRVDRTMDWFGEDADSDLTTAVAGTRTELRPSLDLFAQFSYSRWEAEVSEEKNELFHPQTHLRWSISPAHTLTGGVELRRQEFSRSAAGDTPAQDTYGAFLQHEWWPCDQLTVMTALRYESVEDIDSVLSPKVSLVYAPDLPLILRASVARGFRAPSPQELYEEGYGHGGRALRFGNPDLDPEYSTTYSLGAELFPGQPLQVMLYGHYSDVDDMIVPVFEGPWAKDPTKDVWRRTNVAEARVCGAEIKARYAFSRHCRLEGGYSYTDSEDEGTGRQLPYDPGSSAFLKAIVGGDLSPQWRWSSFLALRAVFGRSAWSWKPAPGAPPADPSGLTTDLDDYQKLDAGASLHYRERYEFYVTVDNILGQDIEHLDDVFTVIDGEPVITAGLKATW